MKTIFKSTFRRNLFLVLLILLAQGCKLADLRTSEVKDTSSDREERAINLLDQVIEKQGLKVMAEAETYSIQATDNWHGPISIMNPFPKENEKMQMRFRPMSFDGGFNYMETKRKTFYGTQSLQSYEKKEDGSVKFKNKEKITFSLAAIQYYIELPLRLRSAPVLKYAGTRSFEGKTYDLVFATWEKVDPHKEHDQYLLYISKENGYLSFINHTVRGMYMPFPKNMFGSVRFANMKTSEDGIVYASKWYIQINNLKKESKSAHEISLSDLQLNSFDQAELYPNEDLPFLGDSKN